LAPGIAAALVSFCFLIGVAFFVQRYLALRRKRKGGFYPSTASMGNALQELQRLTRPNVQYVLEEKQKEDKQDDEEGGPDDPDRFLRDRH
jgi:hypothetical protein